MRCVWFQIEYKKIIEDIKLKNIYIRISKYFTTYILNNII